MMMEQTSDIDRCWMRIGVWAPGGATCPILKEVIHCRSCNVYSKGGREYLRQSIISDAGDIIARSKTYAAPTTSRKKEGKSILVFRLGVEWLALEMTFVQKILNEKPVRWIPHLSGKLIKGIANFDGDALLVFSVRDLLGIDEETNVTQQDRRKVYSRMVVFGNEENRIMFPVDDIYGRHQYAPESLRPLPDTLSQAKINYSQGLIGIDDRQVGILHGDLLLYGIEQALV
jgi:chemotaxis-related protein WspD